MPETPPQSPDWNSAVDVISQKNGLDPALVRRVIQAESQGNPRAISPKGAVGLMQLMPETAAHYGVDPKDPIQNIGAGAAELKYLLGKYNNHYGKAIAAYNAGEGAVDGAKTAIPQIPETQQYVLKVLGGYQPPAKAAPPRTTPPEELGTISQDRPSFWERLTRAVTGGIPRYSSHTVYNPKYGSQQFLEPESFMTAEEQRNHPVITGASEVLGSMTSPENLALIAGSGGLGSLPGIAGKLLPRLVSGAFSAQMLYGAYQNYKPFKEAIDRGDESEAKRLATHFILSLYLAKKAGEHAVADKPLIRPEDVSKTVESVKGAAEATGKGVTDLRKAARVAAPLPNAITQKDAFVQGAERHFSLKQQAVHASLTDKIVKTQENLFQTIDEITKRDDLDPDKKGAIDHTALLQTLQYELQTKEINLGSLRPTAGTQFLGRLHDHLASTPSLDYAHAHDLLLDVDGELTQKYLTANEREALSNFRESLLNAVGARIDELDPNREIPGREVPGQVSKDYEALRNLSQNPLVEKLRTAGSGLEFFRALKDASLIDKQEIDEFLGKPTLQKFEKSAEPLYRFALRKGALPSTYEAVKAHPFAALAGGLVGLKASSILGIGHLGLGQWSALGLGAGGTLGAGYAANWADAFQAYREIRSIDEATRKAAKPLPPPSEPSETPTPNGTPPKTPSAAGPPTPPQAGEDDLEQARRGAPAESPTTPVNLVPKEERASSLISKEAEESSTSRIEDRTEAKKGLEKSEDFAKEIQTGGGKFRGIQQSIPGHPGLVLFDDPKTGSTLALAPGKVTAENVRAHIAESRTKFTKSQGEKQSTFGTHEGLIVKALKDLGADVPGERKVLLYKRAAEIYSAGHENDDPMALLDAINSIRVGAKGTTLNVGLNPLSFLAPGDRYEALKAQFTKNESELQAAKRQASLGNTRDTDAVRVGPSGERGGYVEAAPRGTRSPQRIAFLERESERLQKKMLDTFKDFIKGLKPEEAKQLHAELQGDADTYSGKAAGLDKILTGDILAKDLRKLLQMPSTPKAMKAGIRKALGDIIDTEGKPSIVNLRFGSAALKTKVTEAHEYIKSELKKTGVTEDIIENLKPLYLQRLSEMSRKDPETGDLAPNSATARALEKQIKATLLQSGVPENDIDTVFEHLGTLVTNKPVMLKYPTYKSVRKGLVSEITLRNLQSATGKGVKQLTDFSPEEKARYKELKEAEQSALRKGAAVIPAEARDMRDAEIRERVETFRERFQKAAAHSQQLADFVDRQHKVSLGTYRQTLNDLVANRVKLQDHIGEDPDQPYVISERTLRGLLSAPGTIGQAVGSENIQAAQAKFRVELQRRSAETAQKENAWKATLKETLLGKPEKVPERRGLAAQAVGPKNYFSDKWKDVEAVDQLNAQIARMNLKEAKAARVKAMTAALKSGDTEMADALQRRIDELTPAKPKTPEESLSASLKKPAKPSLTIGSAVAAKLLDGEVVKATVQQLNPGSVVIETDGKKYKLPFRNVKQLDEHDNH